jgi:formate--tetrahydrofolate ligase
VSEPNESALRAGLANLEKHLDNIRLFGVPAVVSINRFTTDPPNEIAIVQDCCQRRGIQAIVADVWGAGGKGAEALAHAVTQAADAFDGDFRPLYEWEWPVKRKVETICQQIYGAEAVDFLPKAVSDLRTIKKLGLEQLPVCIAKTQKSLSDNPELLGRPKDFVVTVRTIEIAAGAGFLIPITGEIMRMPGLPAEPSAQRVDIDDHGRISGLF